MLLSEMLCVLEAFEKTEARGVVRRRRVDRLLASKAKKAPPLEKLLLCPKLGSMSFREAAKLCAYVHLRSLVLV